MMARNTLRLPVRRSELPLSLDGGGLAPRASKAGGHLGLDEVGRLEVQRSHRMERVETDDGNDV